MPSLKQRAHQELQGYSAMLGAVLIFALLPYFLQFLAPLSGNMLFSHRVLWQLISGLILLVVIGSLGNLWSLLYNKQVMMSAVFTVPLIALQWWVFFWAPVNDHLIDVAMGYFLLPLTMALSGRLFLNEKMNRWQSLALVMALAGVLVELYRTGTFSWVTLIVCLGYPPYFLIKRKVKTETQVNFVLENLLLLPFALFYMLLAVNDGEALLPDQDWP